MSQYLSFELKKNRFAKWLGFLPDTIDMGYLCTTPARTISDYTFDYTEEDKRVTKGNIDILGQMVDEYKEHLNNATREYKTFVDMILLAKTEEASKVLLERLDETKGFLEYAVENYKEVVGWCKMIKRIWVKSFFFKPFYSLYYTNC